MEKNSNSIAVFGGGAWGTSLAITIAQNIAQVQMYIRNTQLVEQINHNNTSNTKLGQIVLPKNITATDQIDNIQSTSIGIIAVPTQSLDQLFQKIKSTNKIRNFVICSKGIDNRTLKLPSQICKEFFPNQGIAILSGPNFANEIACNKISKTIIASNNEQLLIKLKLILSTNYFKIEMSKDIMGIEICGAVKNVIAIGMGIARGLELGENFISALLVFSLHEIENIVKLFGGNKQTIYSLAGLGDLLLTSYSLTSRNTNFGFHIAKDKEKLDLNNTLVEGYYTAKSIYKITKSLGIKMPLCHYVYNVLYNNKKINDILELIQ